MARKTNLSGKLRHRVTIQSVMQVADSYGEPIETWGTYAKRWAAIWPVSGREYFTAKQTNSENTVKFVMRYDSIMGAVTTRHRISYDNRIFDIESVINESENDKTVVIMARENT